MHAEEFEQEELPEDFQLYQEEVPDDGEQYASWIEEDDFDDDDDDESLASMELDDDEDPDEEIDIDDDDEAEFVLPYLAYKGVSRLLRPRRPRRYRRYRYSPGAGRGVRGGVIRTRRGSVRVRLPRSVVPMAQYRQDMARLTRRDNQLTARINRTQKDLAQTDAKAVRALSLANVNRRTLRALRKRHRLDISKLRKQQKSDATMNLMMNLMQVQGLQDALKEHTHPTVGAPPEDIQGTGDGSMFMLLPLLMDKGSEDNTALMMMLMMMQQQG